MGDLTPLLRCETPPRYFSVSSGDTSAGEPMLVTSAGVTLFRRRRASIQIATAPTKATTASAAAIQVVIEGEDEPDGVNITTAVVTTFPCGLTIDGLCREVGDQDR